MTIKISITSDFICPWCLVGERRLSKAIETLAQGAQVELEWLPFELNPEMPVGGLDRKIYRSMKFGSWERSQVLDAHTVEAAKNDDVAFDYARIEKTPNTFQAHRLTQFAAKAGKATEVASAIFAAYFENGLDIGNVDVLVEIASANDLPAEAVRKYLTTHEGSAEVRELEIASQHRGVRSVPSFQIGDEIISGAQSTEVFAAAIERAAQQIPACNDRSCASA